MNTRTLFLIILIVLLAGGLLWGQDFQLVYNEGDISVKQGANWTTIQPGDLLPENSVVRLDQGEIAEFVSASTTVLFSQAGTYQLKSAAKQSEDRKVSGLSSIFSRISKMGSAGERGQSQAMGVRGAESGEEYEFTWVEEDTISFDEAMAAYKRSDYAAAIEIFENEIDPVLLNDQGAYWYYLASSYLNSDRKGPAMQIALTHDVDQHSSVYPEFLLLKGELFLESLDYSQAAEQFRKYLDSVNTPAQLQLGNFLYGYSLRQQGDRAGGREALNKAVEIDADSEITRLARQFL